MYIDSDKVFIYPVANRGDSEQGYLGKLNIEQNIVNQKLNLVDNKSFALSPKIELNGNKLIINSGVFIIHGYVINILKPIQVSLSSYFNASNYWVYFSIKVQSKTITAGTNPIIQISENELVGKDTDAGFYGGFTFDITENYVPESSIDSNDVITYNLILGLLAYNSEIGWNFYQNQVLNCKEGAANMAFSITDASIGNASNTLLTDWFKNEFILDDGEI